MRLTRVQKTILMAVGVTGCYKSLGRLTDELDLNYSHAYNAVRALEGEGLIHVEKPGRDLILTMGLMPDGD